MATRKDEKRISDENMCFKIAAFSSLGDREEQQDNVGFDIKPMDGFAVICDGMGGHKGGRQASAMAVNAFLSAYNSQYPIGDVPAFFCDTAKKIDTAIASLMDENGKKLNAGTTLVAVSVEQNHVNWICVGDSRIYIFKNDELVQVTSDHVYQSLLDERKAVGIIDDETFEAESRKGSSLISFLGANGLPAIGFSQKPICLEKNDIIVLMSDGLYKQVSDDEVKSILSNFSNIEDAIVALDMKAQRNAKLRGQSRDNTTIVLIKIK